MTTAAPIEKNHRRLKRKVAKRGTTISCRKGLGLGPNLAVGIKDLSEEGIRLLVREWITKGTDVEIALTGVGLSKPITLMGEVMWCNPIESGFLLGVRFRIRIGYADFFHLT